MSEAPRRHRPAPRMSWVRTWLPLAIIASGLVLMALVRNENGLEGGTLLIGAGLSVWLLNWFFRVGVRGDRDRVAEDRARAFFDAHGHWPDEAPPAAREPEPAPQDEAPPAAREPEPAPEDLPSPRDPHRRRLPSDRFERPGSRPRRPGP